MTGFRSHFRQYTLLWITLGVFVLTILFVNPIREVALDDDFAYALTVKHLVETGEYKLHDYAVANMPFQAYWGALFVHFMGYSHSTLRISTLVLAFFGLIAFYFLAREHNLDHTLAGLLTFGLLASPLIVRFSFTFMTDIPFLMCLIIALLFYTRAIRLHSYPLMFMASIAGAATILTRQTGIVLIGGLFFVWALGKERKQQAPFYVVGMTLPILAFVWLSYFTFYNPNWGALRFRYDQPTYLSSLKLVLANLFRRPVLILNYLALFSLPFALVAFWDMLTSRIGKLFLGALIPVGLGMIILALAAIGLGLDTYSGYQGVVTALIIGGIGVSLVVLLLFLILRQRSEFEQGGLCISGVQLPFKSDIKLLGVITIYFLGFALLVALRGGTPFMPYMGSNFNRLASLTPALGFLTVFTSAGGILFARIFALRYLDSKEWKELPPGERLLDLATLFFLVAHLLLWAMVDEYLISFLPFSLIVVGRYLKNWLSRGRVFVLVVIACLAVLVVSALETRAVMAEEEAMWRSSDFALAIGGQVEDVLPLTNHFHWLYYHGVLERSLADYGYRVEHNSPAEARAAFARFDERWLFGLADRAQYWVTRSPDPTTWRIKEFSLSPTDDDWEIIQEIPYRDFFLQEKYVYVMKRASRR